MKDVPEPRFSATTPARQLATSSARDGSMATTDEALTNLAQPTMASVDQRSETEKPSALVVTEDDVDCTAMFPISVTP